MSIQFRSRVKSVKDFGSDLKKIGTCCYTDGTSDQITFYECFINNGTFLVGDNVSCPQQGEIGNCFACSYLTFDQKIQVANNPAVLGANPDWGKATTSQCECSRIGGVFHPTNPLNLLGIDARIPQSCCYFAYDASGFPIGITCENVCSERECSLRGITFNDGTLRNVPVYNSSETCATSNCSTSGLTDFLYKQMAVGAASTTTEDVGACFDLTKITSGFSYECNLSFKDDCFGYWISPETEEDGFVFCNSSFSPENPTKLANRKIEPYSMSEVDFDLLGLTSGDEFQGGIYIGKFTVNSSSSKVYGSLNLKEPVEQHYNDTTPRDVYSKWALIVDKYDYYAVYMSPEEQTSTMPNTSLSDGFYNCYGDRINFYGHGTKLINTITGQIRRGFADYYIPSIIELYYLSNKINKDSSLKTKLNIKNKLASSSIFYENILSNSSEKYSFNGHVFVYGQNFTNTTKFGYTVLMPTDTNVYLRLFRKVILT